MLVERGIALFIHLLGVIALFVAMAVVQLSGARIRSSSTVEEVRLWLKLLQATNRMFPIGSLLILLSGLYMTARMWSFRMPWVVVAMASIVVMGVVGGRVVGQGIGRLFGAASGMGPVSSELVRVARAPGLWVAATAVNGMALGLIWIMVRKSGWVESIVAVGALAALGAALGARMSRSRTVEPRLAEDRGSKAREVSA